MAGIGFELKRMFAQKGLFASIRAYSYAGIICAGPMVLGVALLLGARLITGYAGASGHERELLNSMITYALLGSLTLTSLFSMATTRAIADMLFTKQRERIMPTFYGSSAVMLVIGSIGYGTFLHFSGVPLLYKVLNLILFTTLVVVWTEINYLTAVKDYKEILVTFFIALLCALLLGAALSIWVNIEPIAAMLIGIICGYGIMMVRYFLTLYKYFPEGKGSSLHFLRWFDKYPELSFVGFFLTLGLFGHLVIMWASKIGVQVEGLFYGAPAYDIPALIAFFSILITTVNFVTSVEVRFYPCYKDYFSLFNDKGSLEDIEDAEKNMFVVLREELIYLSQKQLFSTVLFIVIGTLVLPYLELGFNSDMLGTFRVLCVGYAFYAIANSIMLIELYFADNKNSMKNSFFFMVIGNIFTILLMNGASSFYGFGFLLGGAVFFLFSMIRLSMFLKRIKYHVLSCQPVFKSDTKGLFTPLCDRLDARYERKHEQEKYSIKTTTGGRINV
ncbi:MAG: hypothetical protein A2Y15_00245 [Clostridiales bacterium GWF2_36_10]|nr:MAG: hypothetical protein A2Y15_00245 [Clostridiales bacterium GWF2_36_10]HAN21780.1 hypothetical protein [Clostridiales bacterium]